MKYYIEMSRVKHYNFYIGAVELLEIRWCLLSFRTRRRRKINNKKEDGDDVVPNFGFGLKKIITN